MKFVIYETLSYEIDAPDAQAAIDKFRSPGGMPRPRLVIEWKVFDENMNEQDFQTS